MIRFFAPLIVSTHSRPKAAGRPSLNCSPVQNLFQHTAARRRLAAGERAEEQGEDVSTHSRPKAAGPSSLTRSTSWTFQHTAARRRLARHRDTNGLDRRFNTQPPEGGWKRLTQDALGRTGFNTQPPEGGWVDFRRLFALLGVVSTHSRPKAAGAKGWLQKMREEFQHTAARRRLANPIIMIFSFI